MNKLDILPRKTMSIQNFLLKQTLKKKKKKESEIKPSTKNSSGPKCLIQTQNYIN